MPRKPHVSERAKATTVYLEPEDKAAINWISASRTSVGSERTRLNDILVDALWYYVEKAEKKTKEEIAATLPSPSVTPTETAEPSKITQMPKPKR